MKKFYKVLAITGVIALILGLILLIFGLSFGSYRSIGIGEHGLIFGDTKMKEGREMLSSFHNIELEVDRVNIELIPSDHYELEYAYEERGELTWNVEQESLKITSKKVTEFYLFHFSFRNDFKTKNSIKIYYPKEEELEFVFIDTNVGNIILKENKITKLNIDNDLGNVEIINSIINNSSLSLDLGNLEVSNSTIRNSEFELDLGNLELHNVDSQNLKAECSMGNMEIDGLLQGKTTLECSMGHIEVRTSLEEKLYSYQIKNSIGNTKINGRNTSNTIQKITGEHELKITNNMGDIQLDFE